MTEPQRQSPEGKKVSLFVTCMVDMLHPQTGWSVVKILEHIGVEVDFPSAQTCCGQPGYNAGYRTEAKAVAIQFLKAFDSAEVIVAPSGSCVAMIRHEYPTFFADDPLWAEKANHVASITWEFTEYLVDGLGITDLGSRLPEQRSIAIHDACHGLRLLGLKDQPRSLLDHTENLERTELTECDVCCGFGGLFSLKMSALSGAMLERKLEHITASEADTIVSGDVSCGTHIKGGLARQGSAKRVRHIADVLAEGLTEHT